MKLFIFIIMFFGMAYCPSIMDKCPSFPDRNALLDSIERVESGGNVNAVSSKNAKTSYQLRQIALKDYYRRTGEYITFDILLKDYEKAGEVAWDHYLNDLEYFSKIYTCPVLSQVIAISAYHSGKERAKKCHISWRYVWQVHPVLFDVFCDKYLDRLYHVNGTYIGLK